MTQVQTLPSIQFWLVWFVAFVGFPIGGLLAKIVVGPVSSLTTAALAGAITGAVLGLVQWFVLKQQLPVSSFWVLATSLSMAVGLATSVALFGSEVNDHNLFLRAVLTGFCVGLAQALVSRSSLSLTTLQTSIWVIAVSLGFEMGWFITKAVGVDLSQKWTVFGATGAWTFQILTGTAIYLFLRSSLIVNQGLK